MLKQLYLVMFEAEHVVSAGGSSCFSVASFSTLGRQTLLFLNVMSLHLTLVSDKKVEDLPLFFIPFAPSHLLLLKEKIPHCQQNGQPFFYRFQLS